MSRKYFAIVMCVALTVGSTVFAQSVEEIVAGNLEAKGGEEAWLAANTVKMSGTMLMGGGAAGSLEVPFTVEYKRPGKMRLEFIMQGMTAVQAIDGDSGWSVMPFLGKPEPEAMAEDQVKQYQNQAEFDGVLVDYKKKGHSIELLGEEEVDGTPAYKLKATRANGDVDIIYLDEEYLVEFRTESKREVQGNEIETVMVLGDYKEVDGLIFAHSMEMSAAGSEARQVITIHAIEVGPEIPDERFEMPEVTPAEEQPVG